MLLVHLSTLFYGIQLNLVKYQSMFKLIFLITSVIFVYSFRLEGDEFSNKLSLVHKQQNYNVTDENNLSKNRSTQTIQAENQSHLLNSKQLAHFSIDKTNHFSNLILTHNGQKQNRTVNQFNERKFELSHIKDLQQHKGLKNLQEGQKHQVIGVIIENVLGLGVPFVLNKLMGDKKKQPQKPPQYKKNDIQIQNPYAKLFKNGNKNKKKASSKIQYTNPYQNSSRKYYAKKTSKESSPFNLDNPYRKLYKKRYLMDNDIPDSQINQVPFKKSYYSQQKQYKKHDKTLKIDLINQPEATLSANLTIAQSGLILAVNSSNILRETNAAIQPIGNQETIKQTPASKKSNKRAFSETQVHKLIKLKLTNKFRINSLQREKQIQLERQQQSKKVLEQKNIINQ